MADRGGPADRDLRRDAKGSTCHADRPGNRLSLSSLRFGHGDIIEAYVSGTWPGTAAGVSAKWWDDTSGSDPEDFDDDCASEETEKAYHGIPSVYDGLDSDAERLLRFNRHKARRQEKKDADKGRRRRSEQQGHGRRHQGQTV